MSTQHDFSRNPEPRRGPRRAGWLVAAVGLLAAAGAIAQSRLGTIEECLETGTDLVSLPGVAGGSVSARACPGCPSLRLSFDRNTRYFVGKEAVPYARFRELAARERAHLDVFYHPKTRVLTRLRLSAAANSQ